MSVKNFFTMLILSIVLGAIAGAVAIGIEQAVAARQGIESYLNYKGMR